MEGNIELSRQIQFRQLFPDNIILIGFMGSGKSTVGCHVAKLIGFEYYDVDKLIEHRIQQSVAEAFETRGESYFRSIEKEVIYSLRASKQAVIACGGGVVLDSSNIMMLKRHGKLVWLKAQPETVYQRLNGDHTRPLLINTDIETLRDMMESRNHLYSAAADYSVTTDGLTVPQIGEAILALVQDVAS